MNTTKRYYDEIDALKGLAIFFVVLGHSIIRFPLNLHDNEYCLVLFNFVSSIHMPLFFLISGFCFSYNGDYKKFLIKKVDRLILPYIVFNLIDMIPRFLLSQYVNRSRGILESVKRILFNGGEYWFLYVLFIIFAIYPAIHLWQKASMLRKGIFVAVSFCLIIADINISLFRIETVIYYLFYFNLGVVLKTSSIKFFNFKKSFLSILTPIVLFLIWISLIVLPTTCFLDILIALLGIITCYYFTQFEIFNCIFRRFGEYSLQLYLLNGFLLVISREIICRVTEVPFIIILFNMLVDFILSYVFIKYICRRIVFVRKIMGMI